MKRPLVWVAVAMACGMYAGAGGWTGGYLLPALICGAGIGVRSLIPRRSVSQPVSFALIFSGLGLLLWEAHHVGPAGDPLSRWAAEHRGARVEVEGTVWQPDLIIPDRDYASFELHVDRIRRGGVDTAIEGWTHVRWYRPVRPLSNRERVRVSGELSCELGAVNPGVQSIEDYLRRRGVHTALYVRSASGVEVAGRAPRWSPMYWASRLRHAEAIRLREVIPESIYPFILAVWLGDRRDIGKDDNFAYIVSGTAHILSVSGVHMSILYVSLSFFLTILWPGRVRVRAIVALTVIALFAALTGARVSTMRAACMIALYLLADVLEREPDAPTALGIAGILFMAWTPDALLDVGFLLSFASVASLLLYHEPMEAWLTRLTSPDPNRRLIVSRRTWLEKLVAYLTSRKGAAHEVVAASGHVALGARGGVATALSVQILPLPLAIHFFHIVPLAAPLINLMVVPLVGVVLWLSLVTTLAVFVTPSIALIFGHALIVPVRLIEALIHWTASSGAYGMVISPTWMGLAWYGVLAVLIYMALQGRLQPQRRLWLLPASAALCVVCWAPWRPAAEMVFMDVGHGDSTFIRTPDATTLLVDAGDRTDRVDRGEGIVGPFLWGNHVRRIDYLLITHAHSDHIGGARYVLDHFSVGMVIMNAAPTTEAMELEMLAQCKSLGVSVRRVSPGDVVRAGNATFTVLHPPPGWSGVPLNDASLVVKAEWPGMDVLLSGDIERKAESVLAQSPCQGSALKVPHHGSDTSSSGALLEAVRPRLAVISGVELGERGMHPVVLARYRQRGITVLRTDIHGAITLRVEGGAMRAVSERARRGYLAGRP